MRGSRNEALQDHPSFANSLANKSAFMRSGTKAGLPELGGRPEWSKERSLYRQ